MFLVPVKNSKWSTKIVNVLIEIPYNNNCIILCISIIQGLPTRVLNTNICAVCDERILANTDDGIVESTFKLSCNHV